MDPEDSDDEYVSKSARKREMTALQKIGEQLVGLSEGDLDKMPIEDEKLADAIAQARRIRSNSARKRQLQYIGKLMRTIDADPLEQALQSLHLAKKESAAEFHLLEQQREVLLQGSNESIEEIVAFYPQADRQHLRQLVKQHQREVRAGKAGPTSRKVFRYLRELSES